MTGTDLTAAPIQGPLPPRLFVFAASGVCLGLSDVWRFPYLVLEHGSLWFPVLYLAGVLLLGLPLLAAELALARLGHSRPAANFGFLASGEGASPLWQYAGTLVLVTVFVVLSYSMVVAGWMIAYVLRAIAGSLDEASVGALRLVFDSLITDPERLLGWHTLLVLGLAWAAGRGVKDGVGHVGRMLVVAVFVVAALLMVFSLRRYGIDALRGLELAVSWSSLSWSLALDAVTQAFFTLGVCMGAMLILGTHLQPDARVGGLALGVVGLDVLFVAVVSIAALPLAAGEDGAGPGISFAVETVPLALTAVPLGRTLMAAFFLLLLMLVATTALVLMEFLVSWVEAKSGGSRTAAAAATGAAVWAGGLLALLSFSALSFEFEFIGKEKSFGLFDVMDILSAQILLPIIGLLMAVFVGWNVTKGRLSEAIGWSRGMSVLHGLERYLVPAALVVILITLVFGRVLPRV